MEHSIRKRTNDKTDGSEEVILGDKGNSPIHNITYSASFENKETSHKQESKSSPPSSSTSLNENAGCKIILFENRNNADIKNNWFS